MDENMVLVVVLLLAFGLGFSSWAAEPEPDIEFEETVYDFGKVELGEPVVHFYKFRNLGDAELKILKVGTCCGVRASLSSPEVTPPGGEGKIRVSYQPRGREGVRTKRVKVYSNDPDEPTVELKITGSARQPLVTVRPERVEFGEVVRGEERRSEFKVLGSADSGLEAISVESSTDYLRAKVSDAMEEGRRGFRVEVTLSPDVPPGELNERLEIRTDVEGHRLIRVPVQAKVTAPIRSATSAGESGGDMHVPETRYDFGVAEEGEVITHIYKLKNRGSKDLKISKVSGCCGLRASLLSPSVIPPGGEGEVEVTFDTGGRQGSKTRRVRVHSDDLEEPIVELELTGTVRSALWVKPDRLVFGEVTRGSETRRELRVLRVGENGIRVESSAEWLLTKVSPPTQVGEGGVKILVTLSPAAPSGELDERLTIIEAGVEGERSIEVPVYARVTGNLSMVPSRLSFRGVGRGDSLSRKVLVSARRERRFNILGVESDLEGVSTEVTTAEKGRKYEVLLHLRIGDPAGLGNGKLTILTDDPREPVIQVPIYFYKIREESD